MGPTYRFKSILLTSSNNVRTDDGSLNKRADLPSTTISTAPEGIRSSSIVVQTLHNHAVVLPFPKPFDKINRAKEDLSSAAQEQKVRSISIFSPCGKQCPLGQVFDSSLCLPLKVVTEADGHGRPKDIDKNRTYVDVTERSSQGCRIHKSRIDVVLAPSRHLLDGAKRRRLMQLIVTSSSPSFDRILDNAGSGCCGNGFLSRVMFTTSSSLVVTGADTCLSPGREQMVYIRVAQDWCAFCHPSGLRNMPNTDPRERAGATEKPNLAKQGHSRTYHLCL